MASSLDPTKALLSTECRAHYLFLVEAILRRGFRMEMNSTTPVRWLKGFPDTIKQHFVPGPITLLQRSTRLHTPQWANDLDSSFFDVLSSYRLSDASLIFGAASSSLSTAKAAHKRGARFILDRACPDIRVQQQQSKEEAAKLGASFNASADWFVERQVGEYEECDFLLSPSNYSKNSYPEHIQKKTVLVPLFGRAPVAAGSPAPRTSGTFNVGVVGGSPLRKGYVYLLQAWKKLALPNAKLLIRSSGDLAGYPVLTRLIEDCGNVEIIGYLPNLSDFYHRCDAFVLPSIDDGFGMALFEAVAHGVPCIATTNCGASELLQDERDALIVPPYSAEAIANALERLYLDPDLRARLGRDGAVTVAGMQENGVAKPYEQGMDALFAALGIKTPVVPAA